MIDMRINHTFWCFNENSGDTGGLVYDDFGKWDEDKYEFVKPSLWQTLDSGKFIGLDHQIPLGANGVTLNEFYSGLSESEGSNLNGGTKGGGTVVTTEKTTTTTTVATEDTTTTTTVTSTTTSVEPTTGENDVTRGDANCDSQVNMADAVLIMQSIANPDKYTLTDKGEKNADVDGTPGITNKDALAIQRYKLGLSTELLAVMIP